MVLHGTHTAVSLVMKVCLFDPSISTASLRSLCGFLLLFSLPGLCRSLYYVISQRRGWAVESPVRLMRMLRATDQAVVFDEFEVTMGWKKSVAKDIWHVCSMASITSPISCHNILDPTVDAQQIPYSLARFCCLVVHLTIECGLKMAVTNFIRGHYDMRDCLRQIGVSRSRVHLSVWQKR